MLSVALVRRRLASSVYVTVPRFNLLSLDMPDRFEVAIVDKVVKEQEKITLEFEKESAVTKEEINLENAKADKDILILRAEVRPPLPVRLLRCLPPRLTPTRTQSQANGTKLVEAAKASAYRKLQLGVVRIARGVCIVHGSWMTLSRVCDRRTCVTRWRWSWASTAPAQPITTSC